MVAEVQGDGDAGSAWWRGRRVMEMQGSHGDEVQGDGNTGSAGWRKREVREPGRAARLGGT
jgi:hypothetical protein